MFNNKLLLQKWHFFTTKSAIVADFVILGFAATQFVKGHKNRQLLAQ